MAQPIRVTIPYRVPYADTDQMQVVYYANYLVFFERGRNELLRACGYTYQKLESEGAGLPVLEAHIRYIAPARYDDLLEISVWCAECRGARLKICCEIRRANTLLAEGHTIHAHVNLRTLRPTRPSAGFLAAVGAASPSTNTDCS